MTGGNGTAHARNSAGQFAERERLTGERCHLRSAALDYVAHGWGVASALARDGMTFYKGHTRERIGSLAPVLVSARTLRDGHAVASRWRPGPYSIATYVGEDFDVIEEPTRLAALANGCEELRNIRIRSRSPPSGVRFLVEPGAVVRDDLARVRGVNLADRGTLTPLPPTRVLAGQVTWWITPEQAIWRFGDPTTVQDGLQAGAECAGRGEYRVNSSGPY